MTDLSAIITERNSLLDIDRIRQLIDMMVENDLVELSLRDGEVEVNLRRPNVHENGAAVVPAYVEHPLPAGTPAEPAASESVIEAQEADAEILTIKSPMVGTYYASPDPDSAPFIQVGTQVNPNTVVCILEAMKVFNEIKAEMSGTIEKILVNNDQSVEYGQPLFSVKP